MSRLLRLGQFFLVLLMLLFIGACAAHNTIRIETFYAIPAVTYLRDCPNYDCPVATEIYNSDKMTVLEKKADDWWRVQSGRDEKIGWIQRDLLSLTPLTPKTYYIIVDGLTLRNSPAEDAVSRILLAYGEKVQKIAEQGSWWRVVVEKDKSLGWIPAAMAAAEPPKERGTKEANLPGADKTGSAPSQVQPAPRPDSYFVAADTLKLHLIPSDNSEVVKILKVNDKVAKISQSPGWLKVRYLETGAEGWAPAQYFKDVPVTDMTQIVGRKKKPPKKRPQPDTQMQDPFIPEALEPEGM